MRNVSSIIASISMIVVFVLTILFILLVPAFKDYYYVRFDTGGKAYVPRAQRVYVDDVPDIPDIKCYGAVPCYNYSSGTISWDCDYDFLGWYCNGELITADNCPAFNETVTLVAKWSEKNPSVWGPEV